ncbi:MAG: glycosyltransferase family 39 protein, partial [Anaerolineae bacterium]
MISIAPRSSKLLQAMRGSFGLRAIVAWKPSRLLILLLACYVALGLSYHFTVPYASRPDEPWHIAYVKYLQDHGSLPVVNLRNEGFDNRPAWDLEGHQPPLYYAMVEWLTRDEHLVDVDRLYAPNPHIFTTVWGNRNPWLPQSSHAYATLQSGRFLSLCFGLVTLLAVYGMARIFASPTVALLATAFTAFNPMYLFISTSFSNDLAVTALCSVAVWFLASEIGKPLKLWRAAVLGTLIGMATLAKLSGFVLIVLVPVVTLLDRFFWHRHTDREPARTMVGYLALATTIACLIPLPWFLRNWQLYGDPMATSALHSMVGARQGPISLSALGELLDFFWRGYWLDFSPGGLVYGPQWYYAAYGVVLLIALAGLVLVWHKLREERPYLIVCVVWILIYFVALLYSTMQAAKLMGGGRLLFPVSTSISVLIAVGVLHPWPRRWRSILALLVTLMLMGSAIFAWTTILWRNCSINRGKPPERLGEAHV